MRAIGRSNPEVTCTVRFKVIDILIADGALRLAGIGQVLAEAVSIIAV